MIAALARPDVVLLNRRPTLLHLPPQVVNDKNGEGRDRPRVLGNVSLTPGNVRQPVATVVKADVWERAEQHPSVKQWLGLGWIAVKPPEVEAPTDVPPPPDLSGYQGPTAIAMAEGETSEAALRSWLAAESRTAVKDALSKRLAAIAKPAAKR